MNVVCILAGGIGNRFGSAMPKQYHLLNSRPVIEYVIDAAVKSTADEVIIAANNNYRKDLEEKYGVLTIEGGKSRSSSIANVLDYIRSNMKCDNLLIVDAVCPLVTFELMNLYFRYLDEYDAVFTASNITTSLGRFDGGIADRRDYFLIQSPDAYRFGMLESCFKTNNDITTPLHQLPKHAKVKYYFGFQDYIKIVFPHDIAIAETLLKERERQIRFTAHANDTVLKLLAKLRLMDRQNTKIWEKDLDDAVKKLFSLWEIYEFTVNPDAYMGLVLECNSRKYGAVIIKMYSPILKKRYRKELYILKNLQEYHQCALLDYDLEKSAMLLERIIPGDYISFPDDREEIEVMFRDMDKNKLAAASLSDIEPEIKGVFEQTEEEYQIAKNCGYNTNLISYLMDKAKEIYNDIFRHETKYLLHGDVYYKNALCGEHRIRVIDPVGYQDAFIFEYMPFFTYELAKDIHRGDCKKKYYELIRFFDKFTDTTNFDAAVFVFLIKQLIPSIYEANDDYKRANGYIKLIRTLYMDENDQIDLKKLHMGEEI